MHNIDLDAILNANAIAAANAIANVYQEDEDGRERVLVVELAGRAHAMPVARVREVLRTNSHTWVPGTPPEVFGLINVRGMVVTVLDLAVCLGLASNVNSDAVKSVAVVLMEHGGRLVGLAVDSVQDVRPLDETTLVSGATLGGQPTASEGVVRGLVSANGDVVVLLNTTALLARHLMSTDEASR